MWLLISPPFRFRAFRSPLRVDAQGRRAVRFDYAGDGNYQRHQRRDANAPRCLHASFVVAGLRLTQRSKHPWELVPSGITLRSAQIEGKP
jgi:hypothetical protein